MTITPALYYKIRDLLGLDFNRNKKKCKYDSKTEKYYNYRENSWTELETLRLIILYPILYRKYGIYLLYKELSRRIDRSENSIRVRKSFINQKYPILISPVVETLRFPEDYTFGKKIPPILDKIFNDVLDNHKAEIEKQEYLERKRKELEIENGYLGIGN